MPKSTFFSMPEEVILKILEYFDPADLLSVSAVNRQLHALALDNRVWRLLFRRISDVDIAQDEHAKNKYLLYYAFKKGKKFAEDHQIDKANAYFACVQKLLPNFTNEKDKIWASYIYGEMYCHGCGNFKLDINRGESLLIEAANLGNPNAMFLLSKSYFGGFSGHGMGRPQDYAEGLKWLLKAKEAGSILAVGQLVDLYARESRHQFGALEAMDVTTFGIVPIKKNLAEAIKLLKPFSERGEGTVAYLLAEIFLDPRNKRELEDIEVDIADDYLQSLGSDFSLNFDNIESFKEKMKKFAEQGSTKAMSILSDLYEYGCLGDKDISVDEGFEPDAEAAELYEEMLKQAQAEKDIFWLKRSFDLGYMPAGLALGEGFTTGHCSRPYTAHEFQINISLGIEYYKKAVLLGSTRAAYILGCIYAADNPISLEKGFLHTFGVEPNIQEAITWFEKGYRMTPGEFERTGDCKKLDCAHVLATIFQTGKFGISADGKKALKWHQNAIADNKFEHLLAYGALLLKGDPLLGIMPDPTKGEEIFERASLINDHVYAPYLEKIAKAARDDAIHFLKWNIRGAALGEKDCIENLIASFKTRDGNISADWNKLLQEDTPRRTGCDSDSDDEYIYKTKKKPDPGKIIELARVSYIAAKLPQIEDEFLLRLLEAPKGGFNP